MSGRMRAWCRWTDGEAGSSLIEVAAALPFLLLMLVGAVDFGQAYYVGIEVGSAAAAGAAYGVTKFTDTAGMQTAAKLDATDILNMTAQAAWGCECSDGTGASVSCASIPACGINLVNYVDVSTSANFTPLLMYPGVPSMMILTGHSRMRVGP